MNDFNLSQVIETLQLSVGPVVLISGVGLIILSQSNRMSHLIDRIRHFKKDGVKSQHSKAQILLLYRRAKIIRWSIIALILSIFFDSLLIFAIFSSILSDFNSAILITGLFSLTLISLITGLAFYLVDVNLNLSALKIEVEQ